MKQITTIRRTVATMANQLHKLGYSLSKAFKTAWRRIKEGIQGIGYAHIGYLPKVIGQSVAAVLDNDVEIKADAKIIGGYGYKETLGALINIAI